jgi:hypothetical protein
MPEATRVEPQGAGAEAQRAQASAAPGPAGAPVRGPRGLHRLQSAIGNRAVGRLLARQVIASSVDDPSFNPESITNDLRRAIDQMEPSAHPSTSTASQVLSVGGLVGTPDLVFYRKIDVDLTIKSLENLTPSQLNRIRALYTKLEDGHTLEHDLFDKNESGYPTELKPDQELRIKALLQGTRAEDPNTVPEGRIVADAVELHGLLDGKLSEAERERVMALHRRPGEQISRMDAAYRRAYGKDLGTVLDGKLEGLQKMRMYELRDDNVAKADACAIEDKRRAIAALADKPIDPFHPTALLDERKKLMAGIEDIAEMNRREAMADPLNAGKSAAQAVQERMAKVLSVQDGDAGHTLGDELKATLGVAGSGSLRAMVSGSLTAAAAWQLLQMEVDRTTSTDKLAAILRGFRPQAEHDLMVTMHDPNLAPEARLALAHNFEAQVDQQARGYADEFVKKYEAARQLEGVGRPYDDIVESASAVNADMMKALRVGGGKLEDIDELDIAIRKEDVDGIQAVLSKQRNGTAVRALEAEYNKRHPDGPNLRRALFGKAAWSETGGDIKVAEEVDSYYTKALLHGRHASLAGEALTKPDKMSGEEEVAWMAAGGRRERQVTEDTSGFMGTVREWGELPETEAIMRESAKHLTALEAEWKANDPWGRPRGTILAEMRRERATLSGDAAAYEAENAKMVAQLRSGIAMALQIALAVAIPGLGAGLIGTMALNIGATVATNMLALGDAYSLTNFRNDVLGGVLGAAGGKLGEEALGAIASRVVGKAVPEAIEVTESVGLTTALGNEVAAAEKLAQVPLTVKMAKEAGSVLGGIGGTSVATGENGYSFENIGKAFALSGLGKLFAPPHPGAAAAGGGGGERDGGGAGGGGGGGGGGEPARPPGAPPNVDTPGSRAATKPVDAQKAGTADTELHPSQGPHDTEKMPAYEPGTAPTEKAPAQGAKTGGTDPLVPAAPAGPSTQEILKMMPPPAPPGRVNNITDRVAASQLLAAQARAGGRFRLIGGDAANVRAAWNIEYGQGGEPPPAWVDSSGTLVVDATQIRAPVRSADVLAGPVRGPNAPGEPPAPRAPGDSETTQTDAEPFPENEPTLVDRQPMQLQEPSAVRALPHETVMQAPNARSRTESLEMYENAWNDTPGREVALYRNTVTGEYIIVQGKETVVSVGDKQAPRGAGEQQRWKELLDAGADVGHWELEAHVHPIGPGGAVTGENMWPSGAKADMGAVTYEARRSGQPRQSRIDYDIAPGQRGHTEFGYDPTNTAEPIWVDVPTDMQGGRFRWRFRSMESYHDFMETVMHVDLGEIPADLSGAMPTAAEQTGASTTGSDSQSGRSRSGSGSGAGAAARPPGKWELIAQEVTYQTNDPLEAAQIFYNARAAGKHVRMLQDAAHVQSAWRAVSGETTPAPAGWLDAFGNAYVDATRAPELLSGAAPPGPVREPGHDPRPPAEPDSGPAPAPAPTRGGVGDPAASVKAGVIRGVSRTITDPAVAARMFADEVRAGRFVRHINGRRFLVHAWVAEYGGTGDPPPAWVDGHGFLVVDVERVTVPV